MGRQQYRQVPKLARDVKDLMVSKGTIDQEVFLADLIEVFGGPRKLALAMYREFESAPAGGLARQKMIQTIQHLIISTTSMNLTKVVQAADLTDQDIEDLVGNYFEKIDARRLVAPAGAGADEVASASGRDAVAPLAGEAVDVGAA